MREPISWKWLGLCAYGQSLAEQTAAWESRRAGGPDVCLALEHPPTITLGRRGATFDLLATSAELARQGVACHTIERGGRATYHAPGQLVLYPIVSLTERRIGVRTFVWLLEDLMLEIAAAVGVAARRDERGHGIWTEQGKLGAVGIRVREGISTHGLALNVSLDLSGYALIAPCGVRGLPVTSLRAEGVEVEVVDVLAATERACRRRFGDAHGTAIEEARL
jgi:lipoyl(octanoyl) transferase